MSKIKLFTHGADLDGIGCAILAYLAFGRDNVDVEYCDYKDVNEKVEAFIEKEELFKSYDKVYITDISVSEEVANMINILDFPPKRVRLFDHHATALWLNEYEWCEVIVAYDNGVKTSGTELFFKHLDKYGYLDEYEDWKVVNISRFVIMVRDYDTWRWKGFVHNGFMCKKLNDLFDIYGRYDFIDWILKNIELPNKFPYFNEVDKALLNIKQKEINYYIECKDKQLVEKIDKFGNRYGFVFSDRYTSELGNYLSEIHPELDYIAMVNMSNGTVSYRTVKEDIDLGCEIAHSYGGGGHKKAAGSQFDISVIRDLVIREVFG